jgi:proline dehydrogenase
VHYRQALERIRDENLDADILMKLTQLGLDLSPELCEQNLRHLLAVENPARTLWIDMEASGYVDATLRIYQRLLTDFQNAGVCLQAYLHRTEAD